MQKTGRVKLFERSIVDALAVVTHGKKAKPCKYRIFMISTIDYLSIGKQPTIIMSDMSIIKIHLSERNYYVSLSSIN